MAGKYEEYKDYFHIVSIELNK